MYFADCSFQETKDNGLVFLPADIAGKRQGELRVTFRPKAFYPAERGVGAGADFDATITNIAIRDIEDGPRRPSAWHVLEPRDAARARDFLEANYRDEMWDQAFDETAEAFGYDEARRAA